MEYHHIEYHTFLHRFIIFRQGDYSNSEYKQKFKEHIEVLEAYNRGGPIQEHPRIYGTVDRDAGTGRGYRRGCGESAGIDKGKILGDRISAHLGQASVQ